MVPPLATLSPHDEQARLTQQIEVLHHRGAAQPVKAGDEFSGGLWPAGELIEDRTAGRVREGAPHLICWDGFHTSPYGDMYLGDPQGLSPTGFWSAS
jgi:hypothetical protein